MADGNTTIQVSNYLPELAARIRAEHEATSRCLKESVAHAIAAGEALVEAKAKVGHGKWLPWINENCAISERTAQLYMKLAKNKGDIEIRNDVADLSLNEAAALLVVTGGIKKLLDFWAQVQRLGGDHEALVELCASEKVPLIQTPHYDPFFGCSDEQKRDWLFFGYFIGDGDMQHVEWLRQHDWKTPDEWLGEEGRRYRAQWRMTEPSAKFKKAWGAFRAERAGWTFEQTTEWFRHWQANAVKVIEKASRKRKAA